MQFENRISPQLSSLALFFAAMIVLVSACDSGPEFSGDDLSGKVTGKIVDKATSEPIQGADVSITVDSSESFSATTGTDGHFMISDVPASTAAEAEENASASYGLEVNPPAPYRTVRGQVEMAFGNAGDGTNDLVANVTMPLSENSGTVAGQLFIGGFRGDDPRPLRNATVAVTQNLPVQFDANGNPTSTVTTRSTIESDSVGNFTYDGAEIGRDATVSVIVGNNEFEIDTKTIPAKDPSVKIEETLDPNRIPDFEIIDVSPAPGTDVGTADPTVEVTFSRPVAANEFTRDDAPLTGFDSDENDGLHLIDEIRLVPDQAKSAKNLTPQDWIPVEIEFNDDRTQLSIIPQVTLEDGFIYAHQADGFRGGNGFGFNDPRFVDEYGIPYTDDEGTFNFSIGADESAPAVPQVDTTTFISENRDYSDVKAATSATFELASVDNSEAEVKGYEVYYRTVDMRENRTGTRGQFKKAEVTDPNETSSFRNLDLDPDAFYEDGIIPVEQLQATDNAFIAGMNPEDENLNQDYTPFAANDGTYGPVEVKVRAVSINNVRSDFTGVIELGDNVEPQATNANAVDENGDGDDDIVIVEFSEALDPGTVTVDAFTMEDSNGNERDLLNAVEEVNNTSPDFSGVTTVVISLDGGNTIDEGIDPDEIEVDDTVTDLSGNGMDANNNRVPF